MAQCDVLKNKQKKETNLNVKIWTNVYMSNEKCVRRRVVAIQLPTFQSITRK